MFEDAKGINWKTDNAILLLPLFTSLLITKELDHFYNYTKQRDMRFYNIECYYPYLLPYL